MSVSRFVLGALAASWLAGCTLTMTPRPVVIPPQLSLHGDPGRPLTVVGTVLDPKVLEIPQGGTTWLFDPARYAEALAAAVAQALIDRGYRVTADAPDELELIFVYATVVPGVWRAVCFIDVTAATSDGYVHGFQGQGEDVRARTACDQALAQVAVKVLGDPAVHAFLANERQPADDGGEVAP